MWKKIANQFSKTIQIAQVNYSKYLRGVGGTEAYMVTLVTSENVPGERETYDFLKVTLGCSLMSTLIHC